MASKLISIREDIYSALDRMKMADESFSDVISRLISVVKKDPLRHFGIGKELPEPINDVFEEGMDLARKANRQRRAKLQQDLERENPGQ
jgi:predicted CopG family antitoxin